MNRLALEAIVGGALAYVLIGLISTAAVSTVARRGAFAVVRLTGATPAQVICLAGLEAAAATAVGGALGAAVAAFVELSLRHAAAVQQGGPVEVVMPWTLLVALWAVCAVASAIAAALAARASQRPAPHLLLTGRAA